MDFNYTGKLFLSQSVFQPWKSVSTLAKSFIDRLLTLEPERRMTAEETLKHPWLVSMAACSSNKNLHRSISRNLQRRASRASSRGPSSGSTPGSRVSMRSGSRPGSGPRLGVSDRSQCLKISAQQVQGLAGQHGSIILSQSAITHLCYQQPV